MLVIRLLRYVLHTHNAAECLITDCFMYYILFHIVVNAYYEPACSALPVVLVSIMLNFLLIHCAITIDYYYYCYYITITAAWTDRPSPYSVWSYTGKFYTHTTILVTLCSTVLRCYAIIVA
jgi:hypothetical protein